MDLVNLGRPRPDNGHMVGVQSRVDTHGGEQSCLCHTNTFLCIHFSANGCEHAMTRPQVFFVLWGMAVILCNDTFALPSSRYLFSPFKHRLLLLASHCLMSTVFFSFHDWPFMKYASNYFSCAVSLPTCPVLPPPSSSSPFSLNCFPHERFSSHFLVLCSRVSWIGHPLPSLSHHLALAFHTHCWGPPYRRRIGDTM